MIEKSTEHPEDIIDMSQENLDTLNKMAKELELEMIFRYIRVLSEVENQMKYSDQKRVLFEVALIRLSRPEMERDYESIVNRIHNIEEKLENGFVAMQAQQKPEQPSDSAVAEAPQKKILESAVPGEVKSLAGNWHQVLNQLDPVSKNMLNHVTLTVDEAGALVIAFSEDTAYAYFSGEGDQKEELCHVAEELIGKKINIEFRLVADQREYDALPELRGLFADSDIEIEAMD